MKWTPTEIRFMQQNYGRGMSPAEIGAMLGRSGVSVRSYAKAHGLSPKDRYYTAAEKEFVRANQSLTAAELARRMGETETRIHQLRRRIGLSRKNVEMGEKFEAFLREKHAAGWSDAEISAQWGCERHTVGDWRKRLGMPDNALSEHRRRRVAAKTREQLAAAGLSSLAEVRCKAFQAYASRCGLPADLKPREVQMVNFLIKAGPSTRRAIADGIGMPWKGARKSLTGNRPEGTYLMHLINRGLVVALGRVVKRKGRGHSVQLYTVPLQVAHEIFQRRAHGQEHAA